MTKIVSVVVVQITADEVNAGTDDGFRLEIHSTNPASPFTRRFPSLPSDERERGRVDAYSFSVAGEDLDTSELLPGTDLGFRIKALGNDRWKPAAIHIQGLLDDGRLVRLAERRGEIPWVSTDTSEGLPVLEIPFEGVAPF